MTEHSVSDLARSGIYQIVNTTNGKRYVGSAKSFRVRWAKHLGDLRLNRHHSAYLQRSWNAHGSDKFIFEIVEFCEPSELITREQAWLDLLSPQYNVSPTAGSCLGMRHSESTKLKMSASQTGRKVSPETLAKKIGQKRTPEQRARFSAAQKLAFASLSPEQKNERAEKIGAINRARLTGKKQSAELIAKRSAAMAGHVVSDETRLKISAANKGRTQSVEVVAAIAAANRGRKHSEEFRQKCRDRKPSEETRSKMSKASTGRKHSEETKLKLSQAHTGKKMSPEAIAKSVATRRANGRYVVPEHVRLKLSEAGRGRVVSEETRRKIGAANRRNRGFQHEQSDD